MRNADGERLRLPCLVVALASGVALLAACRTQPARVEAATPAELEWARHDVPAAWPARDWFHGLGSEELDQLVDRALEANLDLQAATERVVQADARARQAHAAILPSVGVDGSANYLAGHSANGSYHETDWSALLSASYEIDFWGKNRAKANAAGFERLASQADHDTVMLTTEAGVADTYLEAVSLRERLVIGRANVESARQLLAIVQSRFKAGYAAPVDVANQSGALASLATTIPQLEQSETQSLTALALLLGQPPEHFEVQAQSLEALREPQVTPGLPAELLRRRPDVAHAEASLAAAHADLQAARAALYPSITLTAAGGVANPAVNAAVNSLAGAGPTLNLGAALAQVVFDGGRLRAQRDEAAGHEQELLAGYRASVLAALVDVENALAAIARLDAARTDQQQLLEQSERAYEGARMRYQKGYGDFLGVLEAQRAVFAARDQYAQYRLARLQARVSLCKALGGGWQVGDIDARSALSAASPGVRP